MEEAIKKIREILNIMEDYVPAVNENAVKNRDAYRQVRLSSQDGIKEFKKIRIEALAKFNKIYYKSKKNEIQKDESES